MSDKSNREESYEDVNATQSEKSCWFYKKSDHVKRDCNKFSECGARNPEKFSEGKKNNSIKNYKSDRQKESIKGKMSGRNKVYRRHSK